MRYAAMLALAIALVGCAGSATSSSAATPTGLPATMPPSTGPPPTVALPTVDTEGVTLTDTSCSAPARLAAGSASLRVSNDSSSQANFELLRLETSFNELAQHVAAEQGRIEAGEPLVGAPRGATEVGRVLLAPGLRGALTATLGAGTYAVVCATLGPDAVTSIRVAGPVTVE